MHIFALEFYILSNIVSGLTCTFLFAEIKKSISKWSSLKRSNIKYLFMEQLPVCGEGLMHRFKDNFHRNNQYV